MPYVIAAACIDVMDRSCIEECPVDCIYEGERKLYINPAECIDCGACEPACPVSAISQDRRVPADQSDFVADNARFFDAPLPGRDEPLGMAGGAGAVGPVGVDTELVAAYEAG
ncbi:(4Fe-4S)-binding protein [Actinomadura sp. LD22]|uniref:Ferredoxin n=1 Tax=Actinomadura physcomitrii TaxID=2650748 RepID=A0A6I4MHV9_9ACTN|nr:ferredoxin [Actinomadura physcomitrii]MWA03261.1 (4Fe-4S)-binding protein [Actinomadura physcomitrii]